MARQKSCYYLVLIQFILYLLSSYSADASDTKQIISGNFGLPGIIDLPSAKRFPDGELVLTQQVHKSLARSGISFQALPRVGVSFRYSGHGVGGSEAYGRINHDRSFDVHISVLDESSFLPAISLGLRDFIGTGWYSSEYIVGTKSIGKFDLTMGIGFGRLAGRNSFSNPLGNLSSKFAQRDGKTVGRGGTFGTINWFQGRAANFYGLRYKFSDKVTMEAEYTTDLMLKESSYLNVASPWNVGISYQLNDYLNLSAQQLYGNQVSVTAQVTVNPERPPLLGGKELAPVPMRLRGEGTSPSKNNNLELIKKVLSADEFEIHKLNINENTASIVVTNRKFRSTAQAVGRIASTLQRFTSDDVKYANVSFYFQNLQTATFRVDLDKITNEQFDPIVRMYQEPSIVAVDPKNFAKIEKSEERFMLGIGPYVTHRLFNPDLPLSMETGIEVKAGYQVTNGLRISTTLRKSLLTNLTENKRRSNSVLPRVHSDWVLYDLAGQSGHIHSLKMSYLKNLAPGLYGRMHAGLLEPFFAGVGGEILFKPVQWPIGIGFDMHRVRKRDYDMRFDLRKYTTTVGHISLYYDAGGMFDVELNAGRFLAGDWGLTTTISREFGSGWKIGGYATLTDVPFETFGEGSFDKAIFVSIPIDWITSKPSQTQRILTLRPITRDGGANLSSARQLNRQVENFQNAAFKREFGRMWK